MCGLLRERCPAEKEYIADMCEKTGASYEKTCSQAT